MADVTHRGIEELDAIQGFWRGSRFAALESSWA
jgi:hypothetical protein